MPSFSYSRPRSSPSTCTWAPFFRLAAKSANLPNEAERCHSVRDSHAPSEFFHERCVATENAVKVDPLLIVFVSASPPVNPMRVSLLRYIIVFFSCSARVSWGTQEREAAAPKARRCFSGGTRMGEPEPETASSDEAEASKTAGRGNLARSCAQDRRADQENHCSSTLPFRFRRSR